MLHDMLRAAAATEDRLIGEAKTARLLRKLPLADLYKFATEGTLGGEEVDGDSWVTRFAGTPLAGAATELATQELELETQIAQNRALSEGVLQQKDQLSIQKRLLDIELVRAQTEEAEKAQAAEAEQQQAAAEQQAPPQADDQAAPPDQPVAGTPPGAEVAPPAAPKTAAWGGAVLGAATGGEGNRIGGGASGGAAAWAAESAAARLQKKYPATAAALDATSPIIGAAGGRAYRELRGEKKPTFTLAEKDEHEKSDKPDESKVAAITEKALDALKKGLAVDHRAVSEAARRHLEDVDAGSKSPGGKKEAGAADLSKAKGVRRLGQLITGSRSRKLDAARERQVGRMSNVLDAAERKARHAGESNPDADRIVGKLDTRLLGLHNEHDKEVWKSAITRGTTAGLAAGAAQTAYNHLKKPEDEKPAAKVAGVLDTARGLVTRGHELVTGSKVRAIEGALEGKVKELGNARDVALHRSSEAEKVLSRGPSIYKGKEILPGPTREARMRAAREVNEHGAAATRLGKEIADTTADTAAAAKTEARKVMGTRVGLVAAPLALGAAAAGTGSPPADPAKVAMVGQAISGLLSHPVAGRVANFAIAHPTAAAGIAGGAVGGVGGALSTDAQGKHSLGRVAAGVAGGAAAGAGIQQAYANRGAISEAAQKAVAGIKAKMAPAAAAAAPAAAEAVPAAAV